MIELEKLSSSKSVKMWDFQVGLFAQYFISNVSLPRNQTFKLLDVGCGTGSALKEFHKETNLAELTGCDIEELHVDLARHMNSAVGTFFKASISEISGNYDFIYASNIFEHIKNWRECISQLCALAPTVFVMVPYLEDLSEQVPSGVENVDHVNSFDQNSFSFLTDSGFSVQTRIITTPYAWGWPIHREILQKIRYHRLGKRYQMRREIIFLISRYEYSIEMPIRATFRNRIESKLRSIEVTRKARWKLNLEN